MYEASHFSYHSGTHMLTQSYTALYVQRYQNSCVLWLEMTNPGHIPDADIWISVFIVIYIHIFS